MWNGQTRDRFAEIRKTLKRYSMDMTDEEWAVIAPLFPAPKGRG